MRLVELQPQFLARVTDDKWRNVGTLQEADGIQFVCPHCLAMNKMVRAGVHSIVCWRPRVPLTTSPTPGRWEFEGKDFVDLTLKAASSSIRLKGGCCAHFFIKAGVILNA